MPRFFYDPALDDGSIVLDRESNTSMGLGGPIIEQCGFIFTMLMGACEDEIEVDGGGVGIAAATFLQLLGIDVCVTFPWDREGW